MCHVAFSIPRPFVQRPCSDLQWHAGSGMQRTWRDYSGLLSLVWRTHRCPQCHARQSSGGAPSRGHVSGVLQEKLCKWLSTQGEAIAAALCTGNILAKSSIAKQTLCQRMPKYSMCIVQQLWPHLVWTATCTASPAVQVRVCQRRGREQVQEAEQSSARASSRVPVCGHMRGRDAVGRSPH